VARGEPPCASCAHLLLEASGVATAAATVLQRKAVVYVRKSTPQQVQSNLESGYISWAEYERNQALLAGNAYGKVGDAKSEVRTG
jgi:hypothetical protein